MHTVITRRAFENTREITSHRPVFSSFEHAKSELYIPGQENNRLYSLLRGYSKKNWVGLCASQYPYPTLFSLHYLHSDEKLHLWQLRTAQLAFPKQNGFCWWCNRNNKKSFRLKNVPNSRLDCKNHTIVMSKMVRYVIYDLPPAFPTPTGTISNQIHIALTQ